jgi:hypothetical protein
VCLGLAFAMLIISPRAFTAMLWMAAKPPGHGSPLGHLPRAGLKPPMEDALVGARARRRAGL